MTINEIIEKLIEFQDEYKQSLIEENAARHKRIDTLNKINELQKAFDKEIEKLKKEMPSESNWNAKQKRVDV